MESDHDSSAITALHRRNGRAESTTGRRFLEHAGSNFGGKGLYQRQPLAQSNEFLVGREAIEAFLARKWQRELDYRLIKELWAFNGNRIAVRFAYEWHDDRAQWFRSYGNENWEFGEDGLMRWRIASINDLPISESERRFHWSLGRRPDDHPSLSDLGF